MRANEPQSSPPIERTPQPSGARTKPASPASPWRAASLGALVVVLVIAAFVATLLAHNGALPGGQLTAIRPVGPRVAPSVYIVDHDAMYAITAANGALRWQSRTFGSLTPDPIIANGVIYTTAIPNSLVTAQRASDGAVLWQKLVIQAEGKRLALVGDTLYMTTDMIGGEVQFPGFVHGVYALRASDGAVRWHHDTTDPVISPPLVVNGIVYAGVGTSLVALRASDGTQLWQRPLTARNHPYLPLWLAFSSGTLYTYGRDQNPDRPYALTASGDATVFALNVTDGVVRWSHTLDGTEPDQEQSAPVIAGDIVYVRSNGLGSQALARGVPSFGFGLHALRASDGAPLWTNPAAITQPVAAGGVVYAGDASGNLLALHGTDGTLIWKHLVAGPARDFWQMSPLAIANGTLYVASGLAGAAASNVTMKALQASDGQQRWTCPLPGSSAPLLGMPVFAA